MRPLSEEGPQVVLPPVPASLVDGAGAPRLGTYEGELSRVELEALSGKWGVPWALRPFKRKRWHYAFVATPQVAALCAIVDVGYGTSAFATAYDLQERRLLADASVLGLPGLTSVGDFPGEGACGRFDSLGARLRVERAPGEGAYRLQGRIAAARTGGGGPFSWDVRLRTAGAAPALTVVAPVTGGGRVNVTQKRGALQAQGTLQAGGRSYVLDGGVGGHDYTHGYLARHTAWRWAYAAGHLADGTPLGLNLVEGFNDSSGEANENALWVGGRLYPLARAQFRYSQYALLEPWSVRTEDGAVELSFQPLFAHREERNLGVVVTRFAQPLGLFQGTLRVGGRTHEVSALPGVTEEQDMRW